jgi:hypothetical protein
MMSFIQRLFARKPVIAKNFAITALRPGDIAVLQFNEALRREECIEIIQFLKSKDEFKHGLILVFDRCAVLGVGRSFKNRDEEGGNGA